VHPIRRIAKWALRSKGVHAIPGHKGTSHHIPPGNPKGHRSVPITVFGQIGTAATYATSRPYPATGGDASHGLAVSGKSHGGTGHSK